jgi:hypothetical protein
MDSADADPDPALFVSDVQDADKIKKFPTLTLAITF